MSNTVTALFMALFMALVVIPFVYKRYRDAKVMGMAGIDRTANDVSIFKGTDIANTPISDISKKINKSKKLQYLFIIVAIFLSSQVFNYLWVYLYQNYSIMIFSIAPTKPDNYLNILIALSIPFYYLYFKQSAKTDYYSKALTYLSNNNNNKKAPI